MAVVVATTSCVKDDVVLPSSAHVPVDNGYAVSVGEALNNLANELNLIEGVETRAGGATRAVKSVKSVKYRDMVSATRAAEAPDDIDDLIYVVEFEDGKGSAVLGADKRVEPVIAILDETVLTPEDFTNPSGDPDTDIKAYMVSLMSESVSTTAEINPIIPPFIPITYKLKMVCDTTVYTSIAPITTTKWSQGSPYNNACYNDDGVLCPAGCVPIAVAQIMMYNKYPSTSIELYGNVFNWSQLSKFEYGNSLTKTPDDYAKIAQFIRLIGRSVNVQYGPDGSLAYDSYAESTLSYNYGSADISNFNINTIRSMLHADKPVYMSGKEAGKTYGHAWVVDGMFHYKVDTYEERYDTTFTPHRLVSRELMTTVTIQKVHCNFGWGSYSDGYYTPTIFDTTRDLFGEDIDTTVGDTGIHGGSSVYNSNFQIITYSFD